MSPNLNPNRRITPDRSFILHANKPLNATENAIIYRQFTMFGIVYFEIEIDKEESKVQI